MSQSKRTITLSDSKKHIDSVSIPVSQLKGSKVSEADAYKVSHWVKSVRQMEMKRSKSGNEREQQPRWPWRQIPAQVNSVPANTLPDSVSAAANCPGAQQAHCGCQLFFRLGNGSHRRDHGQSLMLQSHRTQSLDYPRNVQNLM